MITLAWISVALPLLVGFYAYVGYPLLLKLLARFRRPTHPAPATDPLPSITICLPAYNEEAQIRGALESLLSLDYPAEKRQILVMSDASTDATDEIVCEYAGQGVELLRMPERRGKTAAENAAAQRLTGEIVVNTDCSIRIRPDALRPLIAPFSDPRVGVASGRDVSVARSADDANVGESGYVGYEMRIRALETAVSGIIGASGCFYAIRAELHRTELPEHLSRDFSAALIAREQGYRAVSVDAAVCYVPRTASLKREYRRKVRTMARGMETLFFRRHLLDPIRHGSFAWMLLSHKVARWALPWALLLGMGGLLLLAADHEIARWALGSAASVGGIAAAGWFWPARNGEIPRLLALPAYAVAGNIAVLHATIAAVRGKKDAVWEPTRREVIGNAGTAANHDPVAAAGHP